MSQLTRFEPPQPRGERTRYLVRGTIAPRFVAARALSAKDAITFIPIGARETRAFATMLADGSIREDARGRFWFDMAAYEVAATARRRQMAPLWIAVAVIGAVIAMMFYRG